MPVRTGALSIESANVFGILRTWLYGEQDIVFRELVSNAADAVAKRRDLARQGLVAAGSGRVAVLVDAAAATIDVVDDGIGMTADEVDRYLNQVAFSGATDFARRHAAAAGEDESALIGHFGVGFYSAFMLAGRVSVSTRSATPGAEPVLWECDDQMSWSLEPGERIEVGTAVTLHLPAGSPFLADPEPALAALRTHVAYLGVPVTYTFRDTAGMLSPAHDALSVADPTPVWRRAALGDVDPMEMKAFYRAHFDDPFDPLMWAPVFSPDLGLRGVVFLRDTRGGARELDGRVDVYSRGVFVGRDVPGLVPRFIGLQSVIVECDHLPLVVSRGGVRGDEPGGGVIGLVAEALTQEMAIALHRMVTQDRAEYERLWPEIGSFVKYGALTDRTFAGVMARKILLEDLDGALHTLTEFRGNPAATTVLYASDRAEQSLFIDVFRRAGIPALVLDHVIDQPLLRAMEVSNPGLSFRRLDADPVGLLATDDVLVSGPSAEVLAGELRSRVADRIVGCAVRLVGLRAPDLPVLLALDEASRRTGDMAQLFGLVDGQAVDTAGLVDRTLVLNTASPLVAALAACQDPAMRELAIDHLVDLALLEGSENDPGMLPAHLHRATVLLEHYLATHRPQTSPNREKDTP